MNPIQQQMFPKSRKSRRPNRSEFAPAIKKPIALPVVYAGMYQATDEGSPNWIESLLCSAAVVGTGQKERPKVEDSTCVVEVSQCWYESYVQYKMSLTKITAHVFQVMLTASPSLFCRVSGA
jgi:hypothetical protein